MKTDPNNKIRGFILKNVGDHSHDISKVTTDRFKISRQAVHRYLQNLTKEGLLEAEGQTRNKSYRLKPIHLKGMEFPLKNGIGEDRAWRENFKELFSSLSKNVVDICQYGFTEIFNNAIDHSEGTKITVLVVVNAVDVEIIIKDDGVGIFNKIKNLLGLEDERHAILELTKGKLTTDPEHHTGEEIFFTTRMFDKFVFSSNHLHFSHFKEGDDWLTEHKDTIEKGTTALMGIALDSSRTTKEVFDEYASKKDDYGFTKTHVPVSLLQYGEENLVSRSQAKRLLARFEKFREIFLDFHGVETIGPAFADEIFRVFKRQNPHIHFVWARANKEVEKTIQRALKQGQDVGPNH